MFILKKLWIWFSIFNGLISFLSVGSWVAGWAMIGLSLLLPISGENGPVLYLLPICQKLPLLAFSILVVGNFIYIVRVTKQ